MWRVRSFATAYADHAVKDVNGWAGLAGLLASAASAVASVARQVRLWAILATAWVRVHLGSASPASVANWTAYRAVAFCEDNELGACRELPVREFRWDSWEPDVRAVTGWVAFRVEVRYRVRGKKFRMLLRPGDEARFPPYDNPRPACRFPKGVLSARLLGAAEDGTPIDLDVTTRVQKYQGPHADFHARLGLVVRVGDMFPFDDPEDNRARYDVLRVTDALARTKDYKYAENGVVTH